MTKTKKKYNKNKRINKIKSKKQLSKQKRKYKKFNIKLKKVKTHQKGGSNSSNVGERNCDTSRSIRPCSSGGPKEFDGAPEFPPPFMTNADDCTIL